MNPDLERLSPKDGAFYNLMMQMRPQLKEAQVIIGVHDHGEALFYGLEALEQAYREGKRKVPALKIPYDDDEDSQQPEILAAAVVVMKGRHEYGKCGSLSVPDGNHRVRPLKPR